MVVVYAGRMSTIDVYYLRLFDTVRGRYENGSIPVEATDYVPLNFGY